MYECVQEKQRKMEMDDETNKIYLIDDEAKAAASRYILNLPKREKGNGVWGFRTNVKIDRKRKSGNAFASII